MKFRQSFINKQLDQYMAINYDGYHYNVHRVDPDGYKTKLSLNEHECIKFVEALLNHGWEREDGHRDV